MILIQHASARFINKEREDGFCKNINNATKFKSVFEAMRYLVLINEDSIIDFRFVDDTEPLRCRH